MSTRLPYIALATALILAVPLVAMQFTTEVNWNFFDFVVMGVLLFVTGLLIDIALQKAGRYRFAAAAAIAAAFLWLWAELAVGIFTNWGS